MPLDHCLHNVTVKVNPVLDTARLSRRLEDRWPYENLHEHFITEMYCNTLLRRVMGTRTTWRPAARLLSGDSSKNPQAEHGSGSNNKAEKEGNVKNGADKSKISVKTEPAAGLSAETYKAVAILTGSQFISNCGFGCVIPVLPLFATEMGLGIVKDTSNRHSLTYLREGIATLMNTGWGRQTTAINDHHS